VFDEQPLAVPKMKTHIHKRTGMHFQVALRVEFLLKTESGYLRDAEVT